ncbi:MAG: hypothetical protein KUG72_07595, partial [Pseudomonadales bacterium]|nr:hypothetical protein [Pseudomonadales bacterium]
HSVAWRLIWRYSEDQYEAATAAFLRLWGFVFLRQQVLIPPKIKRNNNVIRQEENNDQPDHEHIQTIARSL